MEKPNFKKPKEQKTDELEKSQKSYVDEYLERKKEQIEQIKKEKSLGIKEFEEIKKQKIEEYLKKIDEIYKKFSEDRELTLEELRLLYLPEDEGYKFDIDILNFSLLNRSYPDYYLSSVNKYYVDKYFDSQENWLEFVNKIKEIKKKRSFKKDLYAIYTAYYRDTKDEQYSLDLDPERAIRLEFESKDSTLFNGKVKISFGDLIFTNIGSLKVNSLYDLHRYGDLPYPTIFPEIVFGSLRFPYVEEAGFKNPDQYWPAFRFPKIIKGERFNGELDLKRLKKIESTEALQFPEIVEGHLSLFSLEEFGGSELKLPQFVSGNLYLNNLKSAKNLKLPKIVMGDIELIGLTSIEGLELPEILNGTLYLSNKNISQEELKKLKDKYPDIKIELIDYYGVQVEEEGGIKYLS